MKLPNVNYSDGIGGLAKRNIRQPLQVAGAQAGAAGAMAGAAGAQAGAAGQEAQSARALASLYGNTARVVTEMEDYFLDQEATRQVQEGQSKQKIALKELTDAQDRIDPETGEAAWKSLPNYRKQVDEITSATTEEMNPRAKAQFDPWAMTANDANMMGQMQKADGWRREDNKFQMSNTVAAQQGANRYGEAQKTLDNALAQQSISPFEHSEAVAKNNAKSSVYTHTTLSETYIAPDADRPANVPAANQLYDEIENDTSINKAQRKELRGNMIKMFSAKMTTGLNQSAENAIAKTGNYFAGYESADKVLKAAVTIPPENFVGGEKGKTQVLSDLRTRRNFYEEMAKTSEGYSRSTFERDVIRRGDTQARAKGSDYSKEYKNVVKEDFWGWEKDEKGKLHETENSLSQKDAFGQDASKHGASYRNLEVIKNQHGVFDGTIVDAADTAFSTAKGVKYQSGVLDFLYAAADGTDLRNSGVNKDTQMFVNMKDSMSSAEATGFINSWRESGSPEISDKKAFNEDFNANLGADGWTTIERDWYKTNLTGEMTAQDKANIRMYTEKYASMGVPVDQATKMSIGLVGKSRSVSRITGKETTVNAETAITNDKNVIGIAKWADVRPDEVEAQMHEQVQPHLEKYSLVKSVEAIQIPADGKIPEGRENMIPTKITGISADGTNFESEVVWLDPYETDFAQDAAEKKQIFEAEKVKTLKENDNVRRMESMRVNGEWNFNLWVTDQELKQNGFSRKDFDNWNYSRKINKLATMVNPARHATREKRTVENVPEVPFTPSASAMQQGAMADQEINP